MKSPERIQRAHALKQLLMDSSPLIEELTSRVCPGCTDVCCKQRHGTHADSDVAYLRLLGVAVPFRNLARLPDGPCESMGPRGCSLPRWLRPHKCTFFFCDQLVAAMHAAPPKKMRQLTGLLQRMTENAQLLGTY